MVSLASLGADKTVASHLGKAVVESLRALAIQVEAAEEGANPGPLLWVGVPRTIRSSELEQTGSLA